MAIDTTPKLSEPQQLQVCQWIATFKSDKEIQQLIKERYGPLLSLSSVYAYRSSKRWQPLIHRVRQEWAAGVADLPIAHKRYRLNELLRMFEQCLADKRLTLEDKRKEGITILREARYEMDEAKSAFTNVFFTQIQSYSDEELSKRGKELVDRLKQLGGLNALRRSQGTQAALSQGQGELAGAEILEAPAEPSSPALPQDGLEGKAGVIDATDTQGVQDQASNGQAVRSQEG